MSESIHAGQLPLWNPYINFGIPQYGDMSSGYWSPVTWLIAATVGYNAYSFTIEVLFYILLGGFGFYKLMDHWVGDKRVKLISGAAYMCCGYNIGHLQHFNWLSGAALLPWCLWSYLLLLKRFSARQALVCAVLFYLLLSSAHPGITISAFYFFAGIALFQFFSRRKKLSFWEEIKMAGKSHFLFLGILLLISAGMLYGYYDLYPHFVRSEKISLEASLSNPTNLQSWISVLLPMAIVKNDLFFHTDLSMRNAYFGLDLLLFFLFACMQPRSKWQNFLTASGCIFLLLSAGGIFKTIAYQFVPFLGYVRLNGEFRIFSIFCFIIVAAITLEKFFRDENRFAGHIKWIYYALEIILTVCILAGLYQAIAHRESILYSGKNIFLQDSLPAKLKSVVDSISKYDPFWIQGTIQLLFLWGIKYCLKGKKLELLKNLSLLNLIIACLLNIPYTGVGKASVSQVQAVLNKSPEGIAVPPLMPVNMNDQLTPEETGLVGDWSMYNKQIGTTHLVPYPIALKETALYFENTLTNKSETFTDHPFLFIFPEKEQQKLTLRSYRPGMIEVDVSAEKGSQVILQQSYYPHWFYQNEKEIKKVNKAGTCFMSAPVTKPDEKMRFIFDPVILKYLMLLSSVVFLSAVVLIFSVKTKRPSLS